MKSKFSRNTACGHNDFCSVRLNGPIWWFILTHQYRLSLSQFTEAVLVESATGPLLLRKSRSLPTQKCHAPPAVAESSRLIDTVNPNNSVIFVENRSFQIVPKQEGAMNRQIRIFQLKFSLAINAMSWHCVFLISTNHSLVVSQTATDRKKHRGLSALIFLVPLPEIFQAILILDGA